MTIYHSSRLTRLTSDSSIRFEGMRPIGIIQGRVIAVVHTEQDRVIRIISARKATRYEEIQFYEEITD